MMSHHHLKKAFERSPKIGAWQEEANKRGYHILYHGTHKDNLEKILDAGLTRKDPKTGMISLTHDPNTAFGYASMSGGESDFRQAGKKAVHTPDKDRVVICFHVPVKYFEQYGDKNFGGNLDRVNGKIKISDDEIYKEWKKKNSGMPDVYFYMKSELRFSKEIPKKFIKSYSVKS